MSRKTRPINLTPGAVSELDSRYSVNLATGCWEWAGTISPVGYGAISINGVAYSAHRASYTRHVGPIPSGLVLDHLCRNPPCINPEHLEPVTDQENVRRGMSIGATAQRRSECLHGHPYPENAKIAQGHRVCRACAANAVVRCRARKAAAKAEAA